MSKNKDKSSQPGKVIVRAFTNTNKRNYSMYKRSYKVKLPEALDYYKAKLKIASRNSKEALAHCPFHDDKKPSLSFNLKTGEFFCHGCGAGGGIIKFHMWFFNVDYPTACKELGGNNE